MKRRGTVFIAENHDDTYLSGTFRTSWQTETSELESADDLSVEQALRWGQARSDRIFVRYGIGDHYWAGAAAGPRDVPSWPPDELGTIERRRHPAFLYLDRTSEEPPITWTATVWLRSAQAPDLWLENADDRVAELARAAGGHWDREERDLLIADMQRAERAAKRAGHPDDYGWASSGRDAYRLRLTVLASTLQQAEAEARSQLDLQDELAIEAIDVRPEETQDRHA